MISIVDYQKNSKGRMQKGEQGRRDVRGKRRDGREGE